MRLKFLIILSVWFSIGGSTFMVAACKVDSISICFGEFNEFRFIVALANDSAIIYRESFDSLEDCTHSKTDRVNAEDKLSMHTIYYYEDTDYALSADVTKALFEYIDDFFISQTIPIYDSIEEISSWQSCYLLPRTIQLYIKYSKPDERCDFFSFSDSGSCIANDVIEDELGDITVRMQYSKPFRDFIVYLCYISTFLGYHADDKDAIIEYIGNIDNQTLSYDGNQLTKVYDACYDLTYAGAMEFRDGADQSDEYSWDANGRMTRDMNRKITDIAYNAIDLPRRVQYSDGPSCTTPTVPMTAQHTITAGYAYNGLDGLQATGYSLIDKLSGKISGNSFILSVKGSQATEIYNLTIDKSKGRLMSLSPYFFTQKPATFYRNFVTPWK